MAPPPPRIYLDHHATTPLDPRVRATMAPFFDAAFGNPHSRSHARGWGAAEALEEARAEVAALIGADPSEIVFTSGATEANNLAIVGTVKAQGGAGHVVTSAIEHPSVVETVAALAETGLRTTVLPVDPEGLIDPGAVDQAIEAETGLVSIGLANHEIGAVQPVAEIAQCCRAQAVPLHVDAAQALGKVPLDVRALGVDLMSVTAHKVYGPMGIGALFVRRGQHLAPLVHGGGQEGGLRSGTVPLPLAAGFGAACRIAGQDMPAESARLRALRDRLFARLCEGIPGIGLNGPRENRLPGNLNVTLPGPGAEDVMVMTPELAMSSGSACASVGDAPSAVLLALGRTAEEADRSLRIGLGRFNTEAEMDEAAGLLIASWQELAA